MRKAIATIVAGIAVLTAVVLFAPRLDARCVPKECGAYAVCIFVLPKDCR
jgi:hypothetical protein